MRPALRQPVLRAATAPVSCRFLTASRWLLAPQPSFKAQQAAVQHTYQPHERGTFASLEAGQDSLPALERQRSPPRSSRAPRTDSTSPFRVFAADGHPTLSSPSMSPEADPSPKDAAKNAATEEWRRSRPHEDYLLSHPVYTQEELDAIQIIERPPTCTSDRVAKWMVKTSRAVFDFVTGYKVGLPISAIQDSRA